MVTRPVVRSFDVRFVKNAAAFVRGGGHALVWEGKRKAKLVFRAPKDELTDLGYWALLDLSRTRYQVERSGPLRGLAVSRIPPDCFSIVRGWATRDSVHEGPTRTLDLDCLACGACCRDNEVVLEDEDIERFVSAGRQDLARRPWAKKGDGRVVLVLQRDKRCKHLAGDNKCGIYPIRPSACSTFPMGSECCLFSRQEELGIVDGAE